MGVDVLVISSAQVRAVVLALTVVLVAHGLPSAVLAVDDGGRVASDRGSEVSEPVPVVSPQVALETAVAGSSILPVDGTDASAYTVASAMVADVAGLVGASFVAHPPTTYGYPNAISTGLRAFPTAGSTFGILTTGSAELAATANTSSSSGRRLGGGNVRGDTDLDVTVLKMDLFTPPGANCLALDFAFLSEEYPEYVGTSFNDAFIAELDSSTWATAGSSISAPDNFAFGPGGEVISINTTGYTAMNIDQAVGTTYDGGTPVLYAARPITSGIHSLYLSIFDQGDDRYDSAVLIDNIRYFKVPNPALGCGAGSAPAGPPANQTWGGWCGATVDVTGKQGDPVDTATGNFLLRLTDLFLPGPGLPYELVRTYNSADGSAGSLGVGWRHSLETNVRLLGSDLEWAAPDGARVRFPADGAGGYVTPQGALVRAQANVGGGWIITQLDGTRYRFGSDGFLQSVTDRSGNALTLAYSAGKLTTVTDSAGRIVTYGYDLSGTLATVTDPIGRTVAYGYTGGRLATVTDLDGGVVTYTYDGSGRLATLVDQNGHTLVTNTYGPTGRVTSQTDASGNTTTFAWDAATSTSTVTDARGGVWVDRYSANKLIARTDPLGNTTEYAYDLDFNLTSVKDPRGNVTTFEWDEYGMLLRLTGPAPLSISATFTYNAGHQLTSGRDGKGNLTQFTYDGSGNLASVRSPDGSIVAYTYNGDGQPTQSIDPLGNTTAYAYDADGNLASIVSATGDRTQMAYDAVGRLLSVVEPRGTVAGADPTLYRRTFSYSQSGRMTLVRDPLGHETTITYDAAGNAIRTADANGHETAYGYDDANRLITVTDPAGGVTQYHVGPTGLVTSRTDANGHATTFDHDLAGRVVAMHGPLGRTWTFAYDANGNVESSTDAAGKTTTYEYDVQNRLVAVRYEDASTTDVLLAYDANGNLTSMTDRGGVETYLYDTLDQLTRVTRAGRSFNYTYDAAGRVVSRTAPGGLTTAYTFDADGRMTSAGGTTYSYLPGGLLSAATTPGGVTSRLTWDRSGRVTEVAHVTASETISRKSYSYDPVGNVLADAGIDGSTAYAYDALDRLTRLCRAETCPNGLSAPEIPCATCVGTFVARPGAALVPDAGDTFRSYTYDGVGNRLTEVGPGGTTTYSYDAADQLTTLTRTDGSTVAYTYDANGNQTAAGDSTFTYDLAGRLASVTAGGSTESYTWSGDGLRLSATMAGQTTAYWWDRNWALPQIAEETAVGRNGLLGVVRAYSYGLGPTGQITAGKTAYYQLDAQGSVMDMTSPSGRLLAWTDYEPFGSTRSFGAAKRTAPSRLLFAGQYSDPFSGTYQLRARQYDPETGRFLTKDPATEAMFRPAVAPYAYTRNNPLRFVDPSGRLPFLLFALPIAGAVVGAFASAAGNLVGSYITGQDPSLTELGNSFVGGAAGGFVAGLGAFGAAAIGAGALATAVGVGASFAGGVVSSVVGDTWWGGKPFNLGDALLSGGLSIVGGKFASKIIGEPKGFLPSTIKGFLTKINGPKMWKAAGLGDFLASIFGSVWKASVKVGIAK